MRLCPGCPRWDPLPRPSAHDDIRVAAGHDIRKCMALPEAHDSDTGLVLTAGRILRPKSPTYLTPPGRRPSPHLGIPRSSDPLAYDKVLLGLCCSPRFAGTYDDNARTRLSGSRRVRTLASAFWFLPLLTQGTVSVPSAGSNLPHPRAETKHAGVPASNLKHEEARTEGTVQASNSVNPTQVLLAPSRTRRASRLIPPSSLSTGVPLTLFTKTLSTSFLRGL
ncbi:hypothetical protein LXA43DRAFT_988482 [Ganoderma leucocontextum]|nr:hypothetical protein LXA43DRAFT_988482 [Ganoderma leucocontextum]